MQENSDSSTEKKTSSTSQIVDGYQTYKIFIAVKTHFANTSYDLAKHDYKSKANIHSYEEHGARAHLWAVLAKLYPQKARLITYLASNFFYDPSLWIPDVCSGGYPYDDRYYEHVKYVKAPLVWFKEDLQKLNLPKNLKPEGHALPLVLDALVAKNIHYATPCILSALLPAWHGSITKALGENHILWQPLEHRLYKMSYFMRPLIDTKYDGLREILKAHMQTKQTEQIW